MLNKCELLLLLSLQKESSYDSGGRKKRIIELCGRLRTMMTPIFLPFPRPLQRVFATPPIKRWNLFPYSLGLGWSVTSLDQQNAVEGKVCQFQAYPSRSIVQFHSVPWAFTLPWEKAQASLLEGERLHEMKISHLSWGHSRSGKIRKTVLLSPVEIIELQNCELNKRLLF